MQTWAQTDSLPSIRTKSNSLVLYLDGEREHFNGIHRLPNPFTYDWGQANQQVSFVLVSEFDSVPMTLQYGQPTNFRIIREAKHDTVLCHFTSHKLVKAATFSEAYRTANQGKTSIEAPEVYELINVIFALTNYGKTPAIYKKTPYYAEVMARFTPFKNHPAVRIIDSLLTQSGDAYFNLKMDSYAYTFAGDTIQNGGVYDRVSWGEVNELAPYRRLLEEFARQSGFRQFYHKHRPYYASLVTDFRKNIDVATMKRWLEQQFPTTHYSAIKVIFSPLVGWNQSANHFSDNNFTEAQAHVDFPFLELDQAKQHPARTRGQRMKIVFTELNHSYINPEAEKYLTEVSGAFVDLSKWVTPNMPSASYDDALRCFEEYMNYALVTLLYHDLFDQKTAEMLRQDVERGMVNHRGFCRFAEFDQELLKLYRNRQPGQTIADLYPAILTWSTKLR